MKPSNKRIVVKIGSSLLADSDTLRLRYAFLHGLLADLAELSAKGYEVVITSSGAVALGLNMMGLRPEEVGLEDKQAAAACGQPLLLSAYKQLGSTHGLRFAQILINGDDVNDPERAANMQNTMERLIARKIIPVVNENDTVTTEAIRVGDNDRLSAQIATMTRAGELIILTNVDGLLNAPPSDPSATLVRVLDDPDNYQDVAQSKSSLGTGGMLTKLQAAAIAKAAGCSTRIGKGIIENPVSTLIRGERKHTFCPGS